LGCRVVNVCGFETFLLLKSDPRGGRRPEHWAFKRRGRCIGGIVFWKEYGIVLSCMYFTRYSGQGQAQGKSHKQQCGIEKNASGNHENLLQTGHFNEFFFMAPCLPSAVRLAFINLSSSEDSYLSSHASKYRVRTHQYQGKPHSTETHVQL